MTNEELRERLTGDDGCVRRKCETCGGAGGRDVPIEDDDYENHANSRLLGTVWHSCCDCDGGRRDRQHHRTSRTSDAHCRRRR